MTDEVIGGAGIPPYRASGEYGQNSNSQSAHAANNTMPVGNIQPMPEYSVGQMHTEMPTAIPPTASISQDSSYAPYMNIQQVQTDNGAVDFQRSRGHAVAKHKRSHLSLIIISGLLALIITVLVVGFFGARSYYAHKAAPGVSFAGENVSGLSEHDLKQLVSSKSTSSILTISDGNGGRSTAKLKELGVQVDAEATVQNILSAKNHNQFAKLNPFEHESVPMVVSVNKGAMNNYLTETFVHQDKRSLPSSIVYDKDSHRFLAHEGKDGSAPRMDSVTSAVEKISQSPGQTIPVKISYHDTGMPITKDTAIHAADDANKRLTTPMVIENGKGGTLTIPVEQVAQWIKPVSDPQKGTITLSYDIEAVTSYAAKELSANLNQDMVAEKNIKNPQGEVLTVTNKGVDGVKIKDTGTTATQIIDQLKSGQITPIKAVADVEPHKVESRTVNYNVPNGDMWVEVNLTTQTATAYAGTTQVKSFPICSGLPRNGDESDLGTFFINVRYAVQTMRGADYVSPNVPWVSYYNGSEGFHTALWNYDAIAHGDAANRGSHGCINMYEQDAKWIYDNCPIGTMVKVIGDQPTQPVR